jgi:hypothetical protein
MSGNANSTLTADAARIAAGAGAAGAAAAGAVGGALAPVTEARNPLYGRADAPGILDSVDPAVRKNAVFDSQSNMAPTGGAANPLYGAELDTAGQDATRNPLYESGVSPAAKTAPGAVRP